MRWRKELEYGGFATLSFSGRTMGYNGVVLVQVKAVN